MNIMSYIKKLLGRNSKEVNYLICPGVKGKVHAHKYYSRKIQKKDTIKMCNFCKRLLLTKD